jgi:hypothetical protein
MRRTTHDQTTHDQSGTISRRFGRHRSLTIICAAAADVLAPGSAALVSSGDPIT